MRIYLGAKFFGHDSAIFLVDANEKRLVALASERITRYKHDDIIAIPAIDACIDYLGLDSLQVSELVVANSFLTHADYVFPAKQYEHECNKRRRYNAPYLKEYLVQERKFSNRIKNWLFKRSSRKIAFPDYLLGLLASRFPNARVTIKSYDHETCHAIGAYFSSGFQKALLITMDGHGDNGVFSRVMLGENGKFTSLSESTSPRRVFDFSFGNRRVYSECSLGGIYSYFTGALGFTPGADEGKVEALAAFSEPINALLSNLEEACYVDAEGTIQIIHDRIENLLRIDRFEQLVGQYSKESLSSTVQELLERVTLKYVRYWIGKTGCGYLSVSGGVFANVILNMKIFEGIVQNLHIMPAMADDGVAEGAAMIAMADNQEDISWISNQKVPYWGRSYDMKGVLAVLEANDSLIEYKYIGREWCRIAADKVVEGRVGAIFHGRMEWGPRALGHRSIVANACDPIMRKRINLEIKRRPEFQPFCPSILDEDREELFERVYLNRHMTCAFRMRPTYVDKFPCAVHIDGTARAQFVTRDEGEYYDFLCELKKKIGIGICINTSFNKHGRTMVESPQDAIRDFLDTDLDFLVIEGYWVTRKQAMSRVNE